MEAATTVFMLVSSCGTHCFTTLERGRCGVVTSLSLPWIRLLYICIRLPCPNGLPSTNHSDAIVLCWFPKDDHSRWHLQHSAVSCSYMVSSKQSLCRCLQLLEPDQSRTSHAEMQRRVLHDPKGQIPSIQPLSRLTSPFILYSWFMVTSSRGHATTLGWRRPGLGRTVCLLIVPQFKLGRYKLFALSKHVRAHTRAAIYSNEDIREGSLLAGPSPEAPMLASESTSRPLHQ